MEFTFKISEEEYLRAAAIAIKPNKVKQPWWSKNAISFWLLIFMILAVATGIYLAPEAVGLSSTAPFSVRLVKALPEAVIPGCIFMWIYSLTGNLLLKFVRRKQQRVIHSGNYRSNPSCKHESTVFLNTEFVRFQCGENCMTQSPWKCYRQWVERDDIVLLVTHNGSRQILQVAGLSQAERQELRDLLTKAIPLQS